MDVNKSTGIDDIPAKFVKIAPDILDDPITHIIDKNIKDYKFYNDVKIAVIPPIFKNDERTLKEILNVFSKVFETYLNRNRLNFWILINILGIFVRALLDN